MKANIVFDISPPITYLGKTLVLELWVKIHKSRGDEVDFLLADNRKSFRQINSVTLGVHSHTCPEYPKQVYNIFAIKNNSRKM